MSIDSLAVKLGGSLPTTSPRTTSSGSESAIDFQSVPTTTAAPADALVATAAGLASALDTGPVSLDSAFAQLLELSEQQYEASDGAQPAAAALTVGIQQPVPESAESNMTDVAAVKATAGLPESALGAVGAAKAAEGGPADSLSPRRVLLVQQPVLRAAQLSGAAAGVSADMGIGVPARVDLASGFEMPVTPSVAASVELGAANSVAPAATSPSPAQPSTVAATSTSSAADVTLNADDPAFPEDFATRVGWMLERGQEQATVRLDPPRLGSMTIQIALSDEVARVQILLTSPLAREVVDNSLVQLRQLFAEAGLSLADVNVSGGGAQGGSEPSQREGLAALRVDDEATEVASVRVRSASSMIDTFA